MIKLTVLYGPPTDPEAFERHYADEHLPLAARIQGVRRFETSKVVGTADGSEPPYHRIAELWFDSAEEMQASLGSPEGQATVDDIPGFATGGATVLVSEVQ